MEGLKKIGMFFAHWIATIIGCFLTLFVVRFLVYQFNIVVAIDVSSDKLAEAALVFIIIGLVVAFECRK